jgi:hypothetical protein
MSKYEAELQRRLDSDDRTPEIVEWYLKSMAAETEIFSELERKFWEDIIDLYLLGKKYSTHFKGSRS